ncbi:exodeoxyribonuclease III [Hasllibacter halocynthiae]|uniref:Exodeoxyribonuclease III n=1 Tax=Hasllibacter halocynthiae TaxID=595589 RepID=A0A2T0X7F3_9RHOB|nr:exodeoxyribonuclease III [Hasllibacter halocynthiae]PRY94881.1 exodeoxyribonuclease III [Hasllibacter halocynthiae]
MRIATFNVNGIKARAQIVADWLRDSAPDIALLQELKSVDEAVPREVFEDAGYNLQTHGQKGFNGVAIAAKHPIEDVRRGLPGAEGAGREGADDEEARWIEATVVGDVAVRVCALYLPNGNPAPGPKYDYKLRWMERMRLRADELLSTEEAVVMGGDYNVIPQRIDVARPEVMEDDALFRPETREAFRRIENMGYFDAFRLREPGPGHYSYWDYQRGAFDRNEGLRIDHHLLSPQAADLLAGAWIETAPRAKAKPSDHTPVWIELGA